MSKLNHQSTQAKKEYLTTLLLSFFLGGLGADRFYLEQYWTGTLKLMSGGGLGFWYLSDLFYTAFGERKDKQGKTLLGNKQYRKVGKILFVASILLALLPAVLLTTSLIQSSNKQRQSNNTSSLGYNKFDQSTYIPYEIELMKSTENDLIAAKDYVQAGDLTHFEAVCTRVNNDQSLIQNAPPLVDAKKNAALYKVKSDAGWYLDCSAAPSFKNWSLQNVISDFTNSIQDIKNSIIILSS